MLTLLLFVIQTFSCCFVNPVALQSSFFSCFVGYGLSKLFLSQFVRISTVDDGKFGRGFISRSIFKSITSNYAIINTANLISLKPSIHNSADIQGHIDSKFYTHIAKTIIIVKFYSNLRIYQKILGVIGSVEISSKGRIGYFN
jgi:hypothetical protein